MQSAIEKELANRIYALRYATANHDRGVVWGMILSCIPVPPISILAIIISYINLNLIKAGKLKEEERGIIMKSLYLATAMLTLGIIFVYMIYNFWVGVNIASFIDALRYGVDSLIEVLKRYLSIGQKINIV